MAEIGRSIRHIQGQPALVLHRKNIPSNRGYVIRLADAWKFSEEHNQDFTFAVSKAAQEAYLHLGMGDVAVSAHTMARRMADVATVIQEGIDDLLKLAPEDPETRVVGEGVMLVDGERSHNFEVVQ